MSSSRRGRQPRLAIAMALAAVVGVQAAAAQAPPPADQQAPADVAALKRLIDEQRTLLDAQGRLIEELSRRLDETTKQVTASQQRLRQLESLAKLEAPEVEQRLAAIEEALQRLPELTSQEQLEAGDFPGALPIPGTEAAIRFGGQVRTLFVRNLGALGTEDRFVTSSIPVEGSPEAEKDSRTTISASPSRFESDFRTPTPVGPLRAYLSGDFAGDNRTYRLRHAFGQWRGFVIGHTWSTFSDPEAEPHGLDFEGLNAISLFRQPIARWTKPLNDRLQLAFALENPSPDITGAEGVNQIPDFVARVRVNYKENEADWRSLFSGGHTQAAILLRQIRGEADARPNEVLSTGGIGLHVSGRVRAPWRHIDYLKFATAAGKGIGRYITDLGTLGGQDAVYDPAQNELQVLPVFSAYLGYEHWWTQTLRSTFTFGTVFVDNLDIQSADSLHETTRSSLNVSWSPVQRVDLVAELLGGRRVNKDGKRGRAGQLQLGWIFRF